MIWQPMQLGNFIQLERAKEAHGHTWYTTIITRADITTQEVLKAAMGAS